MGVESGSITLYQYIDAKNRDCHYHSTQEMAYKYLDIVGVDKTSKHSTSIGEFFIKKQSEYNNVMSLYPRITH